MLLISFLLISHVCSKLNWIYHNNAPRMKTVQTATKSKTTHQVDYSLIKKYCHALIPPIVFGVCWSRLKQTQGNQFPQCLFHLCCGQNWFVWTTHKILWPLTSQEQNLWFLLFISHSYGIPQEIECFLWNIKKTISHWPKQARALEVDSL